MLAVLVVGQLCDVNFCYALPAMIFTGTEHQSPGSAVVEHVA